MSRSLLLAILMFGAMFAGARDAAAETVRCESQDGRYRVCSVDTRGGVRLSQQLSSQGCWQNDTWGYDSNRIWVDRGCRAEFKVGGGGSSSNKDNAVAAAVVVGLAAAVIAADKHNDHRDNRNNNYNNNYNNNNYNNNNYGNNYNNNYGNNYGYGGNPRSTFRCESKDGRFKYCNLPSRGHVEVYKQQSSNPCVHGRSWGVENNRIWVSNGCRADFAVY